MNSKIKNLLILTTVVIAVAGFFWLARFFGSGESVESEKPTVICKPQNVPSEQQQCFWTAHIHATVKVFKNHQEQSVSFEQGNLENGHTHSEKNKLHWHGLIPVDPKTRELTDRSALQIDKIPANLKLAFAGQPNFMVNGKSVTPSYIWQDGDNIEVHYE